MAEWFENENFWEDMYPFLFPERVFDSALAQVEDLITMANFKGGKVLDLCCGPGRHTYELAKKGYQVTAVDRTPYLLNKAREYCVSRQKNIEFVEEEMLHFCREDHYDLVINIFTSFGYYENEKDNYKVLENIYNSLVRGGKLVIDLAGKEIIAKSYHTTGFSELDNMTMVEKRFIHDGWHKITNEWILMREGRYTKHQFSIFVYSGHELKSLLQQAGFKHVVLYGDWDKRSYDQNARRLIAIAEK